MRTQPFWTSRTRLRYTENLPFYPHHRGVALCCCWLLLWQHTAAHVGGNVVRDEVVSSHTRPIVCWCVQENFGVPVADQRLIFSGDQCPDDTKVREVGIDSQTST